MWVCFWLLFDYRKRTVALPGYSTELIRLGSGIRSSLIREVNGEVRDDRKAKLTHNQHVKSLLYNIRLSRQDQEVDAGVDRHGFAETG